MEGASFVESARDVLTAVHSLESSTRETRGALRGEIRLTASTMLGQHVLASIVARFVLDHPEVNIHLDLSNRVIDLTRDKEMLPCR